MAFHAAAALLIGTWVAAPLALLLVLDYVMRRRGL